MAEMVFSISLNGVGTVRETRGGFRKGKRSAIVRIYDEMTASEIREFRELVVLIVETMRGATEAEIPELLAHAVQEKFRDHMMLFHDSCGGIISKAADGLRCAVCGAPVLCKVVTDIHRQTH